MINSETPPCEQVGETCVPYNNALQRHVEYFSQTYGSDSNNKEIGILSTAAGLRKIGLSDSYLGSLTTAALLLKLGGIPSNISDIAQAKHLADTGIYDVKGDFNPVAFEYIKKFDNNTDDALSLSELQYMINQHRQRDLATHTWKGWGKCQILKGTTAAKQEDVNLIKLFADTCINQNTKKEQIVISFNRLRQFYLNSTYFFMEAAKNVSQGITWDPCKGLIASSSKIDL